MYYLTPDTIAQAINNIKDLDSKTGGLFCVLSCLPKKIEENINYEIDGAKLRNQLIFVFDKKFKKIIGEFNSSYIIFAKDWNTTFFDKYIKKKIDLLSCAVFCLRRYGFERELTNEELIDLFVKKYNLENLEDNWFSDENSVQIKYNQNDVEENQERFYELMHCDDNFDSLLFNGRGLKKSAADLKSAGQIQTLYSSSGIKSCFLLSDEPLDYYYNIGNSTQRKNSKNLIRFETKYKSSFSRNRILFGAPGTGKSYAINKDLKKLIGEDNDYERVTFHPDYSYANFVGTYKPVPDIDNDGKKKITYKYVPGPFMRVYVNALKNSRTEDVKPFLLIIEEINRANTAAVFGDIFQLLDRGGNFVSEYPIQASEDIKEYLSDELNVDSDEISEIKIPDNMFIWATMNSADQGVFPMDTAFKRRWDFEYLGIDDNDKELHGKYVYLADDKSQKVEWNNLRKAINSFLEKEGINEDKQIGPYFISKNIVVPENGDEIDRDEFIRTFKNKVIMYLFEDAARSKRARIFDGISKDDLRYSKICDEFDKKGINIFNKNIKDDCKLESLTKINNDVEEI